MKLSHAGLAKGQTRLAHINVTSAQFIQDHGIYALFIETGSMSTYEPNRYRRNPRNICLNVLSMLSSLIIIYLVQDFCSAYKPL